MSSEDGYRNPRGVCWTLHTHVFYSGAPGVVSVVSHRPYQLDRINRGQNQLVTDQMRQLPRLREYRDRRIGAEEKHRGTSVRPVELVLPNGYLLTARRASLFPTYASTIPCTPLGADCRYIRIRGHCDAVDDSRTSNVGYSRASRLDFSDGNTELRRTNTHPYMDSIHRRRLKSHRWCICATTELPAVCISLITFGFSPLDPNVASPASVPPNSTRHRDVPIAPSSITANVDVERITLSKHALQSQDVGPMHSNQLCEFDVILALAAQSAFWCHPVIRHGLSELPRLTQFVIGRKRHSCCVIPSSTCVVSEVSTMHYASNGIQGVCFDQGDENRCGVDKSLGDADDTRTHSGGLLLLAALGDAAAGSTAWLSSYSADSSTTCGYDGDNRCAPGNAVKRDLGFLDCRNTGGRIKLNVETGNPEVPLQDGAKLLLCIDAPVGYSLHEVLHVYAQVTSTLLPSCLPRALKELLLPLPERSLSWDGKNNDFDDVDGCDEDMDIFTGGSDHEGSYNGNESDDLLLLRSLGWCSWDAYGTELNLTGLRDVAATKNFGYMIIDDGWQKTVPNRFSDEHNGEESEKVDGEAMFQCAASFEGKLETIGTVANCVQQLHHAGAAGVAHTSHTNRHSNGCGLLEGFNIGRANPANLPSPDNGSFTRGDVYPKILLWHTIIGNWRGISPKLLEQEGLHDLQRYLRYVKARISPCMESLSSMNVWLDEYSLLEPPAASPFFAKFYDYLRKCGVWGNKVDGHGLLSLLSWCEGENMDARNQYTQQDFGELQGYSDIEEFPSWDQADSPKCFTSCGMLDAYLHAVHAASKLAGANRMPRQIRRQQSDVRGLHLQELPPQRAVNVRTRESHQKFCHHAEQLTEKKRENGQLLRKRSLHFTHKIDTQHAHYRFRGIQLLPLWGNCCGDCGTASNTERHCDNDMHKSSYIGFARELDVFAVHTDIRCRLPSTCTCCSASGGKPVATTTTMTNDSLRAADKATLPITVHRMEEERQLSARTGAMRTSRSEQSMAEDKQSAERTSFHIGNAVSTTILQCMAFFPACLYQNRHFLFTRTSDDHKFPGREENAADVARHIWTNACCSILGGCFYRPDWDMILLSKWHGRMHAAARIVCGGPLYCSDLPEALDNTSTKYLLDMISVKSADGMYRQILPSLQVGTPTPDCIFINPLEEPVAYKLINVTMGGFVLGVFGLYDHHGRMYSASIDRDLPRLLQLQHRQSARRRPAHQPERRPQRPELRAPWTYSDDFLCTNVENMNAAKLHPRHSWQCWLYFMNVDIFALTPINVLQPHPSIGTFPPRSRSTEVSFIGRSGSWNPTGAFVFPPTKTSCRFASSHPTTPRSSVEISTGHDTTAAMTTASPLMVTTVNAESSDPQSLSASRHHRRGTREATRMHEPLEKPSTLSSTFVTLNSLVPDFGLCGRHCSDSYSRGCRQSRVAGNGHDDKDSNECECVIVQMLVDGDLLFWCDGPPPNCAVVKPKSALRRATTGSVSHDAAEEKQYCQADVNDNKCSSCKSVVFTLDEMDIMSLLRRNQNSVEQRSPTSTVAADIHTFGCTGPGCTATGTEREESNAKPAHLKDTFAGAEDIRLPGYSAQVIGTAGTAASGVDTGSDRGTENNPSTNAVEAGLLTRHRFFYVEKILRTSRVRDCQYGGFLYTVPAGAGNCILFW